MGHYPLLVTVAAPWLDQTSQHIREYVWNQLMNEPSLIEQTNSMLPHDAVADYIEIGGNWSGLLAHTSHKIQDEFGHEDDAKLVTWELYAEFLAEHKGHCMTNDDGMPVFLDLNSEFVDEDFVGLKWLVIVDYHA